MKNKMRKFTLSLLFVLLTATGTFAQFTSTTNMGMKKPNAGLTSGWDVYLNGNFDQLDTYLSGVNTLTQNSTTPSVSGAQNWKTNNTSTTAITNFTGGISGQNITVLCTDTNTTISSGTNISVQQPFSCTTSNSISFMLSGTVWTEIGRTRLNYGSCSIVVGDTSGSAVTNAQLGPQIRLCQVPVAATVLQITVASDAGTPNVIVGRSRCTTFSSGVCTAETTVNLTSSALAAATNGFEACSNTGGTTGIDGGTTCSATLQNTGLNAGDSIGLVSGTAGGTAKLVTIRIIWRTNS